MKYIATIIENEIKYQTVSEKRAMIVAKLRGQGVTVKDAKFFLFTEAKKEGYYQTAADLDRARETKLAWIVYLDRYCDWIKKTYAKGWELRESAVKRDSTINTQGQKVKVAPKVDKAMSKERAEKLLETPENLDAIKQVLLDKGLTVVEVDDPFILETEEQAEEFLKADTQTLDLVCKALNNMGYEVTLKMAKAA